MKEKTLARLARLEAASAGPAISEEDSRQTMAEIQRRLDRIAATMPETERRHRLSTISPQAIEELICRVSRGIPGPRLRAWADGVISTFQGQQEALL